MDKNEIKEILKDKYEVVSMGEMGFCEDIVEDGNSFYENAKIKAQTVAKALNLDALGDDSGLCVDALSGAPGSISFTPSVMGLLMAAHAVRTILGLE